MRALNYLILVYLIFIFSCKPAEVPALHTIDTDDPNIIWAKRTNFKVDFNHKTRTENIKEMDKNLGAILLEEVERKNLPVYDYYENRLLSDVEVNTIFTKVDSMSVIEPDNNNDKLTAKRKKLDFTSIKRYRVEQEWFFDKSENKLSNRLVSISPLVEQFSGSGESRGDTPLFKIKLD